MFIALLVCVVVFIFHRESSSKLPVSKVVRCTVWQPQRREVTHSTITELVAALTHCHDIDTKS